ncbi:MAG TPA: phytoene/squalene synthase family protein [Deinococcales bacterium]|nr:phytoene/squalene synthase family protein [Deinococcales bacterium]
MPHERERRGDLEACRALTRHHSTSFYLASLLFPRERRQAIWAVYAACREGDDIVDELPPPEAAPRLAGWLGRVRLALAGGQGSDPVSRELARAARAFHVPLAPFEEMHEGFLMDLHGRSYDTLDDLLLYCRRVGGTVGCMVLPVAGSGHPGGAVSEAAMKLGTAMQLTNVLRDVGEDLARGRLYLPREVLERHGVCREDLTSGVVTPGYARCLSELDAVAESLYRESLPFIGALDLSSRFAVSAATAFYQDIGRGLRASGWDNLTRRARVGNARKLALIPGAAWRAWRLTGTAQAAGAPATL